MSRVVNMHPYAAGQPPSKHWGWGLSMERAIAEARKVSGDKPLLATECGYHNRVDNPNHPGVTEPTAVWMCSESEIIRLDHRRLIELAQSLSDKR